MRTNKFLQILTCLVICAVWSICCLNPTDVKACNDESDDCCLHCCLGIRNRAPDFNIKTKEFVRYTYQVPILSHPQPIATTSTGVKIYSGSGAPSITGYERTKDGYFKMRWAYELSCDGLFCGFLGWLNPFRYCKTYPCKNVNSLSELADDACWISSEPRPQCSSPEAPETNIDPVVTGPLQESLIDIGHGSEWGRL